MMIVPGSMEDERMFNAMKHRRMPKHSRLQQQHLTCCAWGFSVESFPYSAAIGEWLSVKKHQGLSKIDHMNEWV